jgi:hypothetical protein
MQSSTDIRQYVSWIHHILPLETLEHKEDVVSVPVSALFLCWRTEVVMRSSQVISFCETPISE